jgi:hypothetical protein
VAIYGQQPGATKGTSGSKSEAVLTESAVGDELVQVLARDAIALSADEAAAAAAVAASSTASAISSSSASDALVPEYIQRAAKLKHVLPLALLLAMRRSASCLFSARSMYA